MSSVTGPARATATRGEPILVCFDGSRDAARALEAGEARRIAARGAPIAGSAGFEAESHGALAGSAWEGIIDDADELDAAAIVIGSRGPSGVMKLFDASLQEQVASTPAGRC